MEVFLTILRLAGVVGFAVSGALTAIKKEMDLLGVCVLGMTTAVFGGIFRDIILNRLPAALTDPTDALLALGVSLVVFIPGVRHAFFRHRRRFEVTLLVADSLGLGCAAVIGTRIAVEAGHGAEPFFVLFLGVLTSVGGGVLRDLFAGDRPYIFVKHIYALAALFGAVVCYLLCLWEHPRLGLLAGMVSVMTVRFLAAHFRWKLPRATMPDDT